MANSGIEAYLQSAKAHYDAKEYDEAIADYTKAIDITPDNMKAEIYLERGNAYREKGDSGHLAEYALALADYAQAFNLEPNNEEIAGRVSAYVDITYRHRGEAYLKNKEYTLAISDYKQSVELNPNPALKAVAENLLAGAYRARDVGANELLDEDEVREWQAEHQTDEDDEDDDDDKEEDDDVVVDGFGFSNGTITRYTGSDTEVVIPNTINGQKVMAIGEHAFWGCKSLTSVNIPSDVTTIGERAFYGCESLASVNIPSGVTTIEESAFNGCKSLTSVNIPSGVTTIGESAFNGCESLTSVNIPSSVTKIEESAFSGCKSLASVNIPSGVTMIGKSTFYGCESLTSVNIPSGVTEIGFQTFWGCKSLTSVNIPSGVTEIGYQAFPWCESLTSVNIPSGVTTIGESAFQGCKSLTSVNIPFGVTTIGSQTFRACKSLTSVNIPSSVTWIWKDAFEYCGALNMASREAILRLAPTTDFSYPIPLKKLKKSACYIATAIYGSYDCPQVWTLRRYRDFTLAESLLGRAFIRIYYAVSPTVVKWFGEKTWFNHLWRGILDRKVEDLRKRGITDTPYADRVW